MISSARHWRAAVWLVLIAAGATFGWRHTHAKESTHEYYLHDVGAIASFGALMSEHRARLDSALTSVGLRPVRTGKFAGTYGITWDVDRARARDIERGRASATVTVSVDDPELPATIADRQLYMEFVRLGPDGPWYLGTENGYVRGLIGSEGKTDQGFGPEVHAALKRVFRDTLSIDEEVRLSLVRQGRDGSPHPRAK